MPGAGKNKVNLNCFVVRLEDLLFLFLAELCHSGEENKSQYNLQKEKREKGATTLAITTPSIMALRMIIISIMVLRMMMLRIMTISIIILSIMKVNIMQSAY